MLQRQGRAKALLPLPHAPDNESFGNNTKAATTASGALSGMTIAGARVRVSGFDALQNQTGGSRGPGRGMTMRSNSGHASTAPSKSGDGGNGISILVPPSGREGPSPKGHLKLEPTDGR